MENEISIPYEIIANKILLIRGEKVMLDRDLAKLYDVKAIRLREQVKRNLEKFPKHFMFKLTKAEADRMVSQNAIPSIKHLGGSLPYAFTEYGILQLANVLRSGRAIQMSIKIIEIYVKIREMLLTNKDLLLEMDEIRKRVSGQDEKVELIFNYLKQFIKEKAEPRRKIGFNRKKD